MIEIVILSRDRPRLLKQAIDSVLRQNSSNMDFKLIVSDNSETERVAEMIRENYQSSDLKFISRNPTFPSTREHTQAIISELTGEYVALFHDDDVMDPGYLKTMSLFLINNQNAVAIGCNAFIFKNNISRSMQKMHNFDCVKLFDNKGDFLFQYLFDTGGKAPFPSYIYATKFLKKISFPELKCGKNGDVILLASLLKYGPIFWLPNPLMYYRLHQSNDNNAYNVRNRICLLNYMATNGLERNSDLMTLFRCDYWYKWFIKQSIKNIFLWRNRVVLKFLLIKLFYFMNKTIFWKGVVARLKRDLL